MDEMFRSKGILYPLRKVAVSLKVLGESHTRVVHHARPGGFASCTGCRPSAAVLPAPSCS
eukprot:3511736-Pleurochrysis_carterae.AAC.1